MRTPKFATVRVCAIVGIVLTTCLGETVVLVLLGSGLVRMKML